MITNGLLACAAASSEGNISCNKLIFFSLSNISGFSNSTFCPLTSVTKYGLMNSRSNCIPSVIDLVVDRAALFDGDDPLFTDLLHRLRDEVADVDVPVRGDGGDLGDLGCGSYGYGVGGEEGDDAVDGGGPRG
jgi:hypothetical protein